MNRFAPSPTGDMHVGNLRIALFNYILAKQANKKFLVRIEDTDATRNMLGSDTEILDLLSLVGVKPDVVEYQSKNIQNHLDAVDTLLHKEKAFFCQCTHEEIKEIKDECKRTGKPYYYSGKCTYLNLKTGVVRVKKPVASIQYIDELKGLVTTSVDNVGSFIILREDGTPTYNLACTVDDMKSRVTEIFRGEDHLPNTPKQIYIRELLGELRHGYGHLPIILDKNGQKLSKRRDTFASVSHLISEGYLISAIVNYLLLIGNSNTPKDIFTLTEAIEWLDILDISKSQPQFDVKMLQFINREHLKLMQDAQLATTLGYLDETFGKLARLFIGEVSTVEELKDKVATVVDPKSLVGEYEEQLNTLWGVWKKLAEPFDTFTELVTYLSTETGLSGKNLYKPLRILLTGMENGPDLEEIYLILTKIKTPYIPCIKG